MVVATAEIRGPGLPVLASDLSVLLIAGPSGSGKSTFIDALLRQGLPSGLDTWLPEDAASWPQIEANDVLKRGDTRALEEAISSATNGITCHYDTFFALRYGLNEHRDDPIWPLFESASCLRIVSIEPSIERLRSQFEERFREQMKSKGAARSAWLRFGNRSIKRFKFSLTGRGMPDSATLYRNASWIKSCHKIWSQSETVLLERVTDADIVRIVPDGIRDNGYSYAPNQLGQPSLLRTH